VPAPGGKLGTIATMLVSLQLDTVAVVLLNETVFAPWVAPNPVPVIVTAVPMSPDVGLKLERTGAGV